MRLLWLHLEHSLDEEVLGLGTSELLQLQEGFGEKPRTVREKAKCPRQVNAWYEISRERAMTYLLSRKCLAIFFVVLANVDL